MPIYKVNGKTYDIPEEKVARFETAYPDAVVGIYDGGTGKEYEMPVSKVDKFKKAFPEWSYSRPVASGTSPGEGQEADSPGMAAVTDNVGTSGDERESTSGNKEGWKPTPIQKALMTGGIQASMARFDAKVDEGKRHLEEMAQYTGSGAAMTGGQVRDAGVAMDTGTGEAVKRYQTPTGELTTDRVEAERVAATYREATGELHRKQDIDRDIDEHIADATRRRSEKFEEDNKEAYVRKDGEGFWNYFFRVLGNNPNTQTAAVTRGVSLYDDSRADEETNYINAELRILEEAKKLREAQKLKKGDGFWDFQNVVNFGQGVKDVVSDVDTYAGGTRGLHKTLQVLDLKEKAERGEELSEKDMKLAEALMIQQRVESSGDTPHGYNAGRTTAEMGRFMVQMAMNPTSGLGKAIAAKAVKKFGEKGAKAWAAKIVGTVAGDAGSSVFLANTLQMPTTLADIGDRQTGEVVVDGEGKVGFVGGDGLGKVIFKGEASAVIENYTEMLGAHFGVIGNAMNRTLGTGIRKIGGGRLLDSVSELTTRIGSTKWAQGIANIERKAQWNGAVGEMLEEEAGIVLNSAITGDNSLSDLVDAGKQIDIALGVGLFGGFVSGIKTVGYPIERYRRNQAVRRADVRGGELLGEAWESIRESLDGASESELPGIVKGIIVEPQRTPEQREAVLEYVLSQSKARGYNQANASERRVMESTGSIETQIENAYDYGYDVSDPEEMNEAKKMLDLQRQRQRLASSLSEDAIMEFDEDPIKALAKWGYDHSLHEPMADYVNAKMVYDGMIQRVRDDIDGRIARSDAMIDSRINRETGMLQPATVRDVDSSDGRRVYIVNGSVAKYDDGTGVDARKSSESIIIRDAETGKVEFADPAQFLGVDEAIDAETEKAAAREQIRREVAQVAANNIDGVLSFTPGDSYSILDAEGNQQPVTVLGNSVDEEGLPVDGSVDVQYADGTIQSVVTSELQQMVDAASSQRVEQYDREREAQRATAEEAAQQAAQSGLNNPNRRTDIMPDDYKTPYDNRPVRASRYIESENGTGGTLYQDENGNDAVVIAAIDENNYVGYFREYDEQGNPTNRWSAKFQNGSGIRENHRDMMTTTQELLPAGHELTEHTSVSTDGLRNLANQLKHGYELQYDEQGNIITTEVAVNMMARDNALGLSDYEAGSIDPARVTSEEYKEAAARLIPYMEALGLSKFNIHWEDGTLYVDHPILKRADTPQQAEQATVPENAETVPNPSENAVSSPSEAAQPITDGETVAETVSTDDGFIPIDPEIKPDENGVIDVSTPVAVNADAEISDEEPKLSALSRVPTDESGEPIYERAEPDTAWDALVEQTEGDEDIAMEVVSDIVAEKENDFKAAEKAFKKVKEGKPEAVKGEGKPTMAERIAAKRMSKDALAKAQEELDHAKSILERWQLIAGTRQRRIDAEKNAALKEQQQWEEAKSRLDKRVRETSEKYRDLPEVMNILEQTDPQSIDEVAAWVLSRYKVLWGSRRNVDTGNVVRAGVQHHTGIGEGERRRLFGLFASEANGGQSLERLAEDVFEEACNEFGVTYDNGQALDALIDVIKGATSRSDITNYIVNNRIARAETEGDALHRYYEDVEAVDREYHERYGMGEAEWMEFNASHEPETELTDDEFQELMTILGGLKADEEYERGEIQEPAADTAGGIGAEGVYTGGIGVGSEGWLDDNGDASRRETEGGTTRGKLVQDSPDEGRGERAAEVGGGDSFTATEVAERGQNKRQAEREGDLILTLTEGNAVGNTSQGLSSDGKGNTLSAHNQINKEQNDFADEPADEQTGSVESSEDYAIKPKPYTNKHGKTLDTYLVTFNRDFSKQEKSSLRSMAKDKKGWYDKETGGWMLRSREDAEVFARTVMSKNSTQLSEEAPLSLDDMQSATKQVSEEISPINLETTPTNSENSSPSEETPVEKETVNPSGNKLVTDEQYAELLAKMRKKIGGQLNMGVDPEILAIGSMMAVYHIEKGARKFAEYVKAMVADLGEKFPARYLKGFYKAAHEMIEDAAPEIAEKMDSDDVVNIADVASIISGHIDAITTAEMVIEEEKADQEREEAEQKLKDERNIRLNPDGTTTETVIEDETEIAVTKGDFIPGVGPTADNEKKAEGKKRPGKSKPKHGTDGGLFDIDEKETASVPPIAVPEPRPAADLMGDSAAYQDREAQTAELVEEIGGVIESRVMMLQLDAESVKPLTMTEVKKIATKYSALKDISDTDLQELVELAMTQLTRSEAIVNVGGTAEQQRSAYDHIVNLYKIQPSLNARDSERLIKQQYSTPTPFGYVMGQFVRAGGKAVGSMLEPSAGNGALTITVHPSLVHVNDIDEARLANLRKLGYGQVTAQDALLPFTGNKVDVVMTNPPFGTVTEKVYDGVFHVSSLEGQMAINALDKMKDDGRAAIVIGGTTSYRTNGSMNPKDAAFFGYLYSHYNVADVINISGKSLYSRNGTGYDVRMILIDGRKTGEFQRVFPPVKAKARAEQVTTFDELYKRVQDDIQQIQQVGNQSADVQREPATTTDGTASAPIRSGSNRPNSGTGQQPDTTSDALGDTPRTDIGQSAPDNDGSRPAGVDNADSGDAGSTDNVPQPTPRQSRSVGSGSAHNGTGRGGSDGRRAATSQPDSGTERLAVKTGLGDEKVPYPNQSGNGFTLMSVVPAAQAQALQKSLGAIGDVDQYLVDELGYSSKEELYGYLAAEQIDSVALAIHQMNNGNAFIIGDMTGVGKGRQGAALIRYAVKQGKVPIYFTQKPTLFTDNYRDLADIGSSDLRPFIIASNPKDANIVDADGNIVHKLPSKKEQERVFAYIMEHGTLPDEYDYVLTTYDQIKNGTADYVQNEDGTWNTEARKLPKKSKGYTTADYNGQTRRDALAKLAEGNIAILDESHTVGGDSGCGRYMQMLTSSAGGVTFLSATFAKRADNMPIYAQHTAIAEAGVKASELIDAIMKGGVTLQEIMSKQLVESGQMIRRERSFEGVTIDWLSVEEETDRRQRAQFDEVAAIFNAIRNFQDDYITPIIDAKNEAAAERGATVGHTQGTKDMGVKNVPFASKMYNLVNQLLFALKVDAVADRVVENLRNGYKPVISFTNTMEGFLSSAPKGVAMDDVPNFSLTLMRALDGVMRFTEKDADENTDGGSISLSELSAEGQSAYNAIRDKITNLSADLPISPMDAIRMKIEETGYSVAEITGRTMQLNRTKDGKYIVETRKDRDKKAAMRDFNSGKLDVLMINKSGSTGISLHASSKFEDQRQRVMVFAQFQSDINDEVQMRGRIDRSGQVTRGRYEYIMSTIPAEQRIQMMFKAKLKSLDANTTSSQKSKFNEMEIVDYLNKYGDEVAWEYMKEHPDLEERLGDPLDMLQEKSAEDGQRTSEKEDTSKKTGCAGKISRYLAFLSVDEQDEIFKEITEAYRVKIQLLDDAGENDLEITTMPLRTDTKRKQIWHDGVNPGSGNAFADNTYVEEVEVDVLKKPMKRDEIIEATRKLAGNLYSERNGVMDWEHYAYNKGEEIHQFYQSKADEALDKLKEAGEARIAKAREKTVAAATKARGRGDNNFTDEEIQSLADTVANEEREKEELKQNKRHNEIMSVNNRIQSLLNRLRTGSIYVVPQDLKQGTAEMFSQTFGTFVGFKFNKSYTLGSSTAIFATLDGRRKVELALSDQAINTIISATEMTYRYSPKEINAITMDNWDSKVPTQTRQKRYIVTGNLLQALVDTEKGERTRGNLISFSTVDGETRQGILMGENFKLTDLRNSVSLSSRLAQIREGKAVVSENGDVQISKEIYDWRHRGKYELRVPKSKQRGGIYTMHPELLKLVEGNNFITKGGNMVAYVTGDNIAKVVDMLSRAPFNLTVLQESKLTETEDEVRYRIEEGGERIEKLFEEAIAGNLKGKPVEIGKLTEAGREYLEKLSGLSFKKNVSFVLNPSDLMHIYRGHFGKNEKDKGQNIPLDMRDIRNLANVISAPDKIIFLKEGDGLRRNMFYFFKEAENGTYNLMEIYSDRKGNLTAKTFYKTRKDAAQRVMDIKKSLLPTSETYFGAILSEDAKLPKFFELSTDGEAESLERNGEGAYSDAEVSMENDPWSKAWGESLRSKWEEREFARRERRRMVEHIGELADKLNLRNVEIVTDTRGLEGRKARAKGFFDKRTGKITVVIPNNVSVADVEQTLLHESVAHYGLRQLLGEHFDEFLDKVYEAAENGIKEQIDLLATRNGWNRRVATEEYLAGLAEKTDFSDRLTGWFTKVKRYFVDMLRKIGFKYLSPGSIGDNELRYILWRSYENLANPGRYRAFEWEAQDVAMKYSLGVPTGYREIEDGGNRGVADSDGLYELNERFNVELDKLTEDNADKITLNLGFPSKLLLAGGVANRSMKLYGNKVIKKMKKHGFKLSELHNLPEAVAHPIAVFNNLGRDGNRSILTELKTANGNFLVTIDLGKGGDDIDFNIVSSVFGKGKEKVISWIEKGYATYINKRKALDYLHYPAPIAETLSSPRLDSAAKIVENFENPTIKEQNNNAEGEEDVRFRDGDFTSRDRAIAAQQYERMLSRGSWQFREATQDSMLGLKSLYESVLTGAKAPGENKKIRIEEVAGYENAYLYENRMSSANNGEQHQYFSRFMKPLLEGIHKLCGSKELDRRILTDYMIAKHGLERNEYMRNEAATNGEDTERDFAGLCGLTGEDDWQVAETVARQMVDDYEADHDTTELWENVKKATNATLEKIYLSGLISEDTYNKVLGMYDFYIPLRGWDETTSDEVYGYLTSKDGPLMGNVFKTARGRNSKADDPIATIAMMADDAIRQGNRNIMKQRFLNFVHGNPSDLVSVNEMWLQHNDVTDEWEPVFADLQPDMTHAEVESEIAKFEAKMEALRTAEPDKYKKGRDARNIPYKVVRGNLNEHQVLVKRNGRTYVITINGNPRAAQALNGLTNPNVETGGVIGNMLKLGEYVNRHLSAFYTTRNPDFVVSNFLRDMLYSNCMTWVKENPRYALCFHKNFGKVNPLTLRRLLSKWEKDSLSDSNYLEKMFKEFMLNGGETGYTSVKDIDGHKRAIAKELKKISKRDAGHKAWYWLGGQLDLLNRSAENCARFAAFLTSREMGRTLDRSIHDAKEVSVNFNKKGSGGKFVNATGQKFLGKIGSYLGGGGRIAYVFWNAGIQGMTNFGRAGKRNPGKALGGAAALFTLGYVIPLLAQMLGGGDGDDDEKNAYYNLPEYVRRSNICFKAGEQWITIPLPIEYRAIYGMGELACGVISGNERYSNSELTLQIASQISQVMPLDMLEGGGGISPFIPSAFKPMTEAYIMNKGWTGLPIYKDTPYNKNEPEWTKAYQSADQHLVGFAKWLNETTGGDDYKKGILDMNPAKLEYLLNGTFGGIVSFPMKIKKGWFETPFGDREFEWRTQPFFNRVVKSGDERTANRKLQNEYFKYLTEYEETNRLRKKYENAADDGILGYAERVDFLYNSPEYLRFEIFEKYKPDIDAIREGIKEETNPEIKKELQGELFSTMRELVDELHSVDK